MVKEFDFNFEYEWQSEEEETVVLSVEARMSEYQPAVMHLANGDPGWPAEGGEIDILRATDPYGEEWDLDKPTLVSQWRTHMDWRGGTTGYRASGKYEWKTVPLREAMEDVAIDAAANQYG